LCTGDVAFQEVQLAAQLKRCAHVWMIGGEQPLPERERSIEKLTG
jgi:hypothetical protein